MAGWWNTRTMRDDPPSHDFIRTPLLHQTQESVKCPARLERANALQILAFEEKAQLWVSRWLALEWCTG